MDATAFLSNLPETLVALGGLVTAITSMKKAREAEAQAKEAQAQAKEAEAAAAVAVATAAEVRKAQREAEAQAAAIAYHDAHNQGVLLVLTYPGAEMDATKLLEVWGWRLGIYVVRPGEPLIPNTPEFEADLRAADCVLLQGLSVEEHATLFQDRSFADRTGEGVSRICLVPKEGTWYKQGLMSDIDMSCTTRIAAEAWVRNAMSSREQAKRMLGIRPGGIAAAKAALAAG